MRRTSLKAGVLVIPTLLLVLFTTVWGTDEPCVALLNEHGLVERLTSDDEEIRSKAFKSMVDREDEVAAGLVFFIENEQNRSQHSEATNAALRTLGELRNPKAIPVLIKYITYPLYPEPIPGWPSPSRGFAHRALYVQRVCPSVHALSRIGQESVPAVVALLLETDHEGQQIAGLRVLQNILGRREAEQRIRDAFANLHSDPVHDHREEGLHKLLADMPSVTH